MLTVGPSVVVGATLPVRGVVAQFFRRVPGRLQAPFDHVYQAASGVLRPGVVEAAQGTVDE